MLGRPTSLRLLIALFLLLPFKLVARVSLALAAGGAFPNCEFLIHDLAPYAHTIAHTCAALP